jgi:hypothetical protein
MTLKRICELAKRRLEDAGLPQQLSPLSPRSFRVMVITDLSMPRMLLEDVQYPTGHTEPRTTRLYKRLQEKVPRNIA